MNPKFAMLETSPNITQGFLSISRSNTCDFTQPVYQVGRGMTCLNISYSPPANLSAADDDDPFPIQYNSASYFCKPSTENHGIIYGINLYSDSSCTSVAYSIIGYEFPEGCIDPNQNSPYYQLVTCQAQDDISTVPLQGGNYAVKFDYFTPPTVNESCVAIGSYSALQQDQCIIEYHTECLCARSSQGSSLGCGSSGYNNCCDGNDDDDFENREDDYEYWDNTPNCNYFPTSMRYGCLEGEGNQSTVSYFTKAIVMLYLAFYYNLTLFSL